MKTVVERWDDLGHEVHLNIESHWMDFKVYPISEWTGPDGQKGIDYYLKDSIATGFAPDLSKAKVFVEGFIKWDGCMNFIYPEQSECMLHTCGLRDAESKWAIIKRLHEKAVEHIPGADQKLILR